MKIRINIEGLVVKEDPKCKMKMLIETIAGVVWAHYPHNKFEIVYHPTKDANDEHRLFFGTERS